MNEGLTKTCTGPCGRELPATTEFFHRHKNGLYGLQEKCKECRSKYAKERWRKHPESSRKKCKRNRSNQKRKVITAYGGKCVCCGEENIGFLTIDHVNGGGLEHRKRIGKRGNKFYQWLINNNFPPGFQVLCFNCNCGQNTHGGICPHKLEAEDE